MDPASGFLTTGAVGIATNLATEIVKHYLQRLNKSPLAPTLKHIGLLPPSQQDQLRSTIKAALILLQQSRKEYDLSHLEGFFSDPVIGHYICDTILNHRETSDAHALQQTVEHYLRKDPVSYLVFQDRGGKLEQILPDFFKCYEQVMQERLGPSDLALLLKFYKSHDELRKTVEGLKTYIDTQLSKYASLSQPTSLTPPVQTTQSDTSTTTTSPLPSTSPASLPLQALSTSSPGETPAISQQATEAVISYDPAHRSIEEIANVIQSHRRINEPLVLVLGARTGALCRNQTLYSRVSKTTSPPDSFDTLSEQEKFRESYKALQHYFSRSEVDTILKVALFNLAVTEGDRLLAELICAGYFETVISTGLDISLEGAIHAEEVRAQFAYQFLIQGREPIEDIIRPYRAGSKIIKLYGVVRPNHESSYNGPRNEFELDSKEHRELRAFLEETFAKDLMIVGYDLIWDAPIKNAFLAPRRGNIYYVNEALLVEDDDLKRVIEKRQGRYLLDPQKGQYSPFIKELHQQLRKTHEPMSC
jgi:hypothetical protein